MDVSIGKYGNLPVIKSENKNINRKFITVNELNKKLSNQIVWVRARLHTSRSRGKQCFIVLRQKEFTIQALLSVSDAVSKAMVKFSSR